MPAMPSAKNSRCTGATFDTTAQSGSAMCASAAISPAWFMPISTTATSCSASSFSSCNGSPKALFRFLCDFSTLSFPCKPRAPSTSATASFVVVLPTDPVIAITRPPQCRRTIRANRCKAASTPSASASGTRSRRLRSTLSGATHPTLTTAATAPFASAAATKSCPSKRSPRTAKKSSPAATVRESIAYPNATSFAANSPSA
jgi:hypothetical protein